LPPLLKKVGNKKRIQERLRLVTARHKLYLFPEGQDIEPVSGFGFVSDFSEEGLGLYLGKKFKLQTPVNVAFEDIKNPTYRGFVVWSSRIEMAQRFIGHEALKYRLGIKFMFGTEAERQRYLAYFEDVRRRVQEINLGI
jgi:hypothetical protein